MAKRGRKSKYETHVKSRFDEITAWLEEGLTDKEIYPRLGIGKNAFYKYKNDYEELRDLLKKGRVQKVEQLKNSLFKKAIGFSYQEKKEIRESNGDVRIEIYTKTSLPDPTAALILLKHWDKDNDGKAKWMSDPATHKLREAELELKKTQAENNNW